MKNLVKVSMLVVALATGAAQAQEHEVYGGSTMGFVGAKGGAFQFALAAGYRNLLTDSVQLGGEVVFSKAKGGNMGMGLAVGPTFNFGPVSDAVYLGVHGVFTMTKPVVGDTNTDYGFDAILGKRFELASNITWNPEARFGMTFKGGSSWNYEVKVVNLAVHF